MNYPRAMVVSVLLLALKALGANASVLDHLSIRSTIDSRYAPRPATLQIQSVTGKSTVYTVSGGLKYTQEIGSVDIGAFTEWQRTTNAKTEQNLLKVGGAGGWQVRGIDDRSATNSPLLSWIVNWKRDQVANASGGQAAINGTWIFRGKGKSPGSWYHPGALAEGRTVAWRYLPYVGMELDAQEHRTPIERGLLSLQTQIYPLPRRWRYDVQGTIDAVYRRSARAEGSLGRDTRKFDFGLNYFFLRQRSEDEPDRAAGISLLYSHGSDPQQGVGSRELRQVAFSVQF